MPKDPPRRLLLLLDAWDWGAARAPAPEVAGIVERAQARYAELRAAHEPSGFASLQSRAEAIMEASEEPR
jgi:hypothetical protein